MTLRKLRSIATVAALTGCLLALTGPLPGPAAAASLPTFDFPWGNGESHTWTGGPHGLLLVNGRYQTCLPPPDSECASKVPSSTRSGLDFGAGDGDWKVRPAAPGTVVYKGLLPKPLGGAGLGFGYGVVIKHDAPYQNVYSLYAHMTAASVAPKVWPPTGKHVGRSNVLGTTGCTGTGATCFRHLHLELRRGMQIAKTDIAFYGSPVSWHGVSIGGWTIKALELNYNGSATRCDLTKPADELGGTVFKAGEPSTCPSPVTLPSWLLRVQDNPILRGVGLAGLRLGDPERTAIEWLGDASVVPYPVKDTAGDLLYYALMYRFKGVLLGVYTTPDTRTVRGIRLYDKDFNSLGFIPGFAGITIGSPRSALIDGLGPPSSTYVHYTCPFSDNRTTTFAYGGIDVWVCDANGLVFLIDIPSNTY